jgi:mannosyl-oligosaccharide glucosidase
MRMLKSKNFLTISVLSIAVLFGAIVANNIWTNFILGDGTGGDNDPFGSSNRVRADVGALGFELDSLLPELALSGYSSSEFFSAEHNSELLWGTYRPQLYAGMRTKTDQDALLTGLMWYEPNSNPLRIHLRHVAKSEESVKFEWVKHDGRSFGIQKLNDTKIGLEMNVTFVKYKTSGNGLGGGGGGGQHHYGGDWVMKVTGHPSPGSKIEQLSMMYYVGLEKQESGKIKLEGTTPNAHLPLLGPTIISGQTPSTSTFSLVLNDNVKKNKKGTYFSGVHLQEEWQVEKTLRIILPKGARKAQLENVVHADANVFVAQRFKKVPFEFEIVFVSNSKARFDSSASLNAYVQQLVDNHEQELELRAQAFDAKFDETFKLNSLGYSAEMVDMAKVALSNMLGGIGFFHGRNRIVQEPSPEHPDQLGWGYIKTPYKLLTATPSRSYFPRGFLWDEGFHQLLISHFDRSLSNDMLLHWLHLVNPSGWIPREQILGHEAETRVPEEFIAQTPDHANPPTLFFPIESLVASGSLTERDVAFLERAFSQLSRNFLWFLKTQHGKLKNTFRWRGASGLHTLASGLDDYPRATNRSNLEEHVDLHCWMIHSAHNLERIALALERYDLPQFKMIAEELTATLHERYWNPSNKAFSDFDGLERKLVDHIGYISLFPMLFGLIPIDSPKLSDTLHLIENDTLLRSPFGIRSLSKSDPLFGTHENYWRGPIWINLNYLTLRALHRYYIRDGPYKERAEAVYHSLRRSIVNNIFRVYKRQGAMYENYNALNGAGQGQHPFAGWTSLVVLIMAEIY